MLLSVAQDNHFRPDHRVVACRLIEGFFGKLYVRRLTLNEYFRFCFFGNQQVDPFGKSVQFHLFFGDEGRGGIAFNAEEILYPVLAHPFFGCEEQPRFSGQIINKKFIFVFPEFKIKSFREIQFRKFHQL